MNLPYRFATSLIFVVAGAAIANQKITFSADVYFDTYSAVITLAGQGRLAYPIASAQKVGGPFCAIVVGHADRLEAGVMDANLLALDRAKAVVALLQASGFPSERIYFESKGASQPIAPPPNTRNSRVEIEVIDCK